MEYIIIIEKSKDGFGAYVPDLPGVGVVGDSKEEVVNSIRKAVKMHISEMKESGRKIPKPKTEAFSLEVA